MKYNDFLKQPKSIYIETTNFCNAKCLMCPHDKMEREQNIMSWELFKKVVEDCKELNLPELTIYLHKEGEPLLDKMLFDRIEYLKNNLPQLKELVINTNAMLLNEDKAKKLIDSGIDKVFFSVDGTTKENYEKLRKGLDYNRVINNLKNFFRIKEEAGSKIYTIMQMLVYVENRHEVHEYQRLWGHLADEIFFKEMHSYLDAEMSQLTSEISEKQHTICPDPFEIMVIYWNGETGVCCWDYDNFAKLGNIVECSILETFNNSNYRKFRNKMVNYRANELNPCQRCFRVFGEDKIKGYSTVDKFVAK